MHKFATYFLMGTALSLTTGWPNVAHADDVSFATIIDNPSDHNLGMRYAMQQERQGNYLAALGAYERILLMDATNDEARLRYAELLTKLDDLQAARREVKILEGRELTPLQSNRLQQLGGKPSQSGGLSGQIEVGVQYDGDAANTLTDTTFSVGNSDDISGTLAASINYSTLLSDNLTFRAGLAGKMLRHETFSALDYETYGAFAGLVTQTAQVKLSADLILSNVNIDNDRYLQQIGGHLGATFKASDSVKWNVIGQYYDQDFNNIGFFIFEDQRSGDYASLTTGPTIGLGDNSELTVLVGFEDKNAKFNSFAYDGLRVGANLHLDLGRDAYLQSEVSFRDLKYDDNFREDKRKHGRMALGMPLRDIIDIDGTDFVWETGISYIERRSNFVSDFDSFGIDSRIIAKF